MVRSNSIPLESRTRAIARELDSAEKLTDAKQKAALSKLATQLEADAQGSNDP